MLQIRSVWPARIAINPRTHVCCYANSPFPKKELAAAAAPQRTPSNAGEAPTPPLNPAIVQYSHSCRYSTGLSQTFLLLYRIHQSISHHHASSHAPQSRFRRESLVRDLVTRVIQEEDEEPARVAAAEPPASPSHEFLGK